MSDTQAPGDALPGSPPGLGLEALERVPVGVFLADHGGRILYANTHLERIFGYEQGKLRGQHFEALIPFDHRSAHRQHVERFQAQPEPRVMGSGLELAGLRQDGTSFPVDVGLSALRLEDCTGVLCTVVDLTAVRHLEQAEARALAAETLEKEKSAWIASVCHEIRTPMNGILGTVRLLLQSDLEVAHREQVLMLELAARRLTDLVNSVLDLSKLESGFIELRLEEFDPAACAREAVAPLTALAWEKGLEMGLAVAPGLPARVRGDRGRLQQVLVNLVGNAIKFTREGSVRIRVGPAEREGPRIRMSFQVTDTGRGIAPDLQEVVFRPFFQGEGQDDGDGRAVGTGLGLPIAARLVEVMGGHLHLESEPGRGSTFEFTVAFEACDPAPGYTGPPLVPAFPRTSRSLRILLAEDERINRHVATQLLSHRGHRVTAVEDGWEALEALEREPFDILVMDVRMPRLGGIEAAERIRQGEFAGGPRLPILALTAQSLNDEHRRCFEAGMDACVTKPFDPEHLFATLERLANPAC